MLSYLSEYEPAFLSHAAERLSALITHQSEALMSQAGVKTPVKSVSVMLFLDAKGNGSIADIARDDDQSHQTVSSRVAPLIKLGLIERYKDPIDQRKVTLRLTELGKEDLKEIRPICRALSSQLASVCNGQGQKLFAALVEAEANLRATPLKSGSNQQNMIELL